MTLGQVKAPNGVIRQKVVFSKDETGSGQATVTGWITVRGNQGGFYACSLSPLSAKARMKAIHVWKEQTQEAALQEMWHENHCIEEKIFGPGNAPGPDYDDDDDDDDDGPRKKRRTTEAPAGRKPYTRKAEEEIRQLQSPDSPELLMPKTLFGRLVLDVVEELHQRDLCGSELRIHRDAMEVLQYATEAFTVDYLADLLCLASHAKRQTVRLEDSAVWKRLRRT